jgi:hypothetical protein
VRIKSLSAALVILAAGGLAGADTLELKNGGAIQGRYVGGTATTVNMETAQGVLAVSTADAAALRFSPPPPAPKIVVPPPAPAAVAPASAPAGTVLTVRLDTEVSSKSKSGSKFSGKLVGDVMAGNVVVLRAGTPVIGSVGQVKQAGRLVGKSQLQMSLVSVDFGGQLVPIQTTNFAETGQSSFRKTARNAAVGGLIGNAFDSSGGAGKGAAVGVGVSLIREGESVTVPPGAILEFRLLQSLNVN